MKVQIGVPYLSATLTEFILELTRGDDVTVVVGEYDPMVIEIYEGLESSPKIQFLAKADLADAALLLVDVESQEMLPMEEMTWTTQRTDSLIAMYTEDVDGFDFLEIQANPRMFGLRFVPMAGKRGALEFVRLDSTTGDTLEQAVALASAAGMKSAVLDYDVPGGFYERIRTPVEMEAWRMVRHTGNEPRLVDHLSQAALGSQAGLLSGLVEAKPGARQELYRRLTFRTSFDSRFTHSAGPLPVEPDGIFWSRFKEDRAEPIQPQGDVPSLDRPVLIVGAPQLVDGWKKALMDSTGGKIRVVDWPLWDLGEITEESVGHVLQQGPYGLILECLVSAVEDRQTLLNALLPALEPKGQVWVHTLNAAATVTVQVAPEDICAVGFGGLPPLDRAGSVELMQPVSSHGHDLARAAGMAKALGLTPYHVVDEPGGVGARLLATLINAALFTVRESIVATPTEADLAAKDLFGMSISPLKLADQVGLDVVEAVLLGLRALLGEERYRVCPLATMRIEAGATGYASGNGFYAR